MVWWHADAVNERVNEFEDWPTWCAHVPKKNSPALIHTAHIKSPRGGHTHRAGAPPPPLHSQCASPALNSFGFCWCCRRRKKPHVSSALRFRKSKSNKLLYCINLCSILFHLTPIRLMQDQKHNSHTIRNCCFFLDNYILSNRVKSRRPTFQRWCFTPCWVQWSKVTTGLLHATQ